ncbi:hypothetical protein [Mycoplasma hafezii]|uniref:hypothetical protein n=1 Tax=Mycoplasma hafezii TaxID=525886 RepID=UPI003CF1E02A
MKKSIKWAISTTLVLGGLAGISTGIMMSEQTLFSRQIPFENKETEFIAKILLSVITSMK